MLSPQLNDILTLAVAIVSPILGFVVFRENRKEKREKMKEKLQSKINEKELIDFRITQQLTSLTERLILKEESNQLGKEIEALKKNQ